MTKYKVTAITGAPKRRGIEIYDTHAAEEIRHVYGLTMFAVSEIVEIWRYYSDTCYDAGWLTPSTEDIERAFGVKLEEIKENLE